MANMTTTSCKLTDDLRNIRNYAEQGKTALVVELIWSAEERIAEITARLADQKQAAGMRGCATLING